MFRPVVIAFAILEALFPDRFIDWGERRAFENPETAELRSWTIPLARLEGLVCVWFAIGNRWRMPIVTRTLSVCGLVALTAPRVVLDLALASAYENPDAIEVKPWVLPLTRVLGVVYIVWAVVGGDDEAKLDK
ncbi:hypothetical protein OB919_19565 [Halobacteria archaeon AArc-curdl1]|uniref:Uncharacterized protein n=1 Tax=Natronosalvus hydrolyticus TaxID=2979988 RepID=A0AAP3E8P8_9EURY|nr:hypothetical protein [Halobacteria archaeon AArc-curdl1]